MVLHRKVFRNLALYCLGALLLVAASCPPQGAGPVTITFDQLGACNGYSQTDPPHGAPQQAVFAGGQAAFVAFRIVLVDNSGSGRDFNFDPERLYVTGSSPPEHVSTSLSLAQDHGQLKTIATTIPAGKTSGGGIAVVRVSTSAVDGASEANNTSYLLSYETTAADPIVLLAKRNLSQTSWPQTPNCRAIDFRF